MTDPTSPKLLFPALDTASNAGNSAAALAQDGYKAVGRYYSQYSWKQLTKTEASELFAADVNTFVVYEDSNDAPSYFSADIGIQQALRALYQADAVIHQPRKTGIYFAVDYDASSYDYTHYIRPYLRAINEVFASFGYPYQVGIYGNGVVCSCAKDDGLATLTWLSQSTGFYGYQEYKESGDWNILQGTYVTIAGTQYDQDTLNLNRGSYGGFGSFAAPSCSK